MPTQKAKDLTDQFTTNGGNAREIKKKIPCAYTFCFQNKCRALDGALQLSSNGLQGMKIKHTHMHFILCTTVPVEGGEICYGYFFLFG
jgi:hypothetical protein